MSAITFTHFKLNSDPTYWHNGNTELDPLLETVAPGDVLILDDENEGYRKTLPGERGHGIAIEAAPSGATDYEFAISGTATGCDGLQPNADIYPSATVPGGLDTETIQHFAPQVRALRADLLRFNFQF